MRAFKAILQDLSSKVLQHTNLPDSRGRQKNAQGVQSIYNTLNVEEADCIRGRNGRCQGKKPPKRLAVKNWNHKNQPAQLTPQLLPVEKKKQMELYRSENAIQQFMRRTEFLTELGKKNKTQFNVTVDREKMRKHLFLVLPNCLVLLYLNTLKRDFHSLLHLIFQLSNMFPFWAWLGEMGKATFITTTALFHSVQARNTHSLTFFQHSVRCLLVITNMFAILFMTLSIFCYLIYEN